MAEIGVRNSNEKRLDSDTFGKIQKSHKAFRYLDVVIRSESFKAINEERAWTKSCN